MITETYQYPTLTREEKNSVRHYRTPDNTLVPSVTTVLAANADEDAASALNAWRARNGPVRAAEITNEAAARGTRMHAFLEGWVKTGILKDHGSNPYSKQSHTMAKQVISKGLAHATEFWGSEVSLYYPELYAGTADLVGRWKGHDAIMDFKQANRRKKIEWLDGYFMQLAAYATAHNRIHGTRIRHGVVLICTKDFEYQEFEISGNEFDSWADKWWATLEKYYQLNT